jgi:hypothetical protein
MLKETLIAIVHTNDIARFTTVLKGADVAITAHTFDPHFEAACRERGAKEVFAQFTPEDAKKYKRVFTLSPLDTNREHQDLAASIAEGHPHVLVPTHVPPFEIAKLLDTDAFEEKLDFLNEVYYLGGCEILTRELSAFEGFARVKADDIARIRSLTHYEQVIEIEDAWSFERSPYEAERLRATVSMVESAAQQLEIRRVMELGACEGLMTRAIAKKLPDAQVIAVEPSPSFAARLTERVDKLKNVEIVRARAGEVALDADLIVAAEVLYYAAADLPRMLRESRARAWVTSYHGDFDHELAALFERHGMHMIEDVTLPPRFERLYGGARGEVDQPTPFIVRRVGCTIRLWLASAN